MQSSLESYAYPYETTSLSRDMQALEFLQGISLDIFDAYIKEDITITEIGDQDSKIELAFVLEGEAEVLATGGQHSTLFNIKPNTAAVLNLPNNKISFSLMQKTKINMFGISLHPHQLNQMLGIDEEINIDKLICSNEFLELSIKQKTILYQIFNSKRQGISRLLFLQSKALELLSNCIDSMLIQIHGSCDANCEHSLSIKEICSIKSAMSILENNMLNPPSLTELSRLVGLNINKLECGFRTVYNKTPYACLREARMLRSSILLAQGQMNVSQVAWEVGYANLGHFSAAFLKQFGVSPKAFQMDRTKERVSILESAN